MAFPLEGSGPELLLGHLADRRPLVWSRDLSTVFFVPARSSKTYAFPLRPGRMFPDIPPAGLDNDSDFLKMPNVTSLDVAGFEPGPTSDVYAFSKQTGQRNLYRIPVP